MHKSLHNEKKENYFNWRNYFLKVDHLLDYKESINKSSKAQSAQTYPLATE